MKKLMAAAAVILLASSTALSGCSSKAGSQAEGGKVKIRFASWNNTEDLDKQQTLVDQFNPSHKDIGVTLEAYGSEYDTKISVGVGSGDTPDVPYIWDYPSYYEGSKPLDSYIEKEGAEYKDNLYDVLWPCNSKNDTIYGIPVGFTTHVLYYNKDIFAQAGVMEPTNDWTWDDVKMAAKTIIGSVSGVKDFSLQMKPDPYDYEMYPWSNGSSLVDASGNLDGNLDSTDSVEAISLLQEMERGGYAVAAERNGTDEFRGGQTAMYIYGAWVVSTFDEDGLNHGIADILAFAGAGRGSVSILSPPGVSISKDFKNKEAARESVKYRIGKEMNKAKVGYELSALESVVEPEEILDNPSNAPLYSMLEQSSSFTPASFIMDNWSTLRDILDSTFGRVYNPSTLEGPTTVLLEVVSEMQ